MVPELYSITIANLSPGSNGADSASVTSWNESFEIAVGAWVPVALLVAPNLVVSGTPADVSIYSL
jgi:Ca2+/H+ antiporter